MQNLNRNTYLSKSAKGTEGMYQKKMFQRIKHAHSTKDGQKGLCKDTLQVKRHSISVNTYEPAVRDWRFVILVYHTQVQISFHYD